VRYLSPGVLERAIALPELLVAIGQSMEGIDRHTPQPLPGEQQPLLKGCTIGDRDVLQKSTSAQPDCLFQRLHGGQVCWTGGAEESEEGAYVYPGVASAVELERLPGDEQERRHSLEACTERGRGVADGLPEAGEGVA
jgi:hypothetical protein